MYAQTLRQKWSLQTYQTTDPRTNITQTETRVVFVSYVGEIGLVPAWQLAEAPSGSRLQAPAPLGAPGALAVTVTPDVEGQYTVTVRGTPVPHVPPHAAVPAGVNPAGRPQGSLTDPACSSVPAVVNGTVYPALQSASTSINVTCECVRPQRPPPSRHGPPRLATRGGGGGAARTRC